MCRHIADGLQYVEAIEFPVAALLHSKKVAYQEKSPNQIVLQSDLDRRRAGENWGGEVGNMGRN